MNNQSTYRRRKNTMNKHKNNINLEIKSSDLNSVTNTKSAQHIQSINQKISLDATIVKIQQKFQKPQVHQLWHDNITNTMRKYLLLKITRALISTKDHKMYCKLCFYKCAAKIESEVFEKANDQDDYFYQLAKFIYTIQKEFEDRLQNRNLLNPVRSQEKIKNSNVFQVKNKQVKSEFKSVKRLYHISKM